MEQAQAHTVHVPLAERAYDIVIGAGLLGRAGELIRPLVRGRQVVVAVDGNIRTPHGEQLAAALQGAGFEVSLAVVPPGEESKCVAQLAALWDALAARKVARDGALVAVGGGVVGDLCGFAAATYLRGIDFVQVPTSLLAMVDSSVGGKTGINHATGKNLLGAFWQPRLVLADTATLHTLPEGERISALAEVIKYGVIRDAEFFAWLEAHIEAVRALGSPALEHAVRRSCELKAEVVAADERETTGLREILNFGHTAGHAVENRVGYGRLRHGECVAIGMVAESRLALPRHAGWTPELHDRLVRLITRAGLPTAIPEGIRLSAATLLDASKSDKKVRSGAVRYLIPSTLGSMEAVRIDDAEALAQFRLLGAVE